MDGLSYKVKYQYLKSSEFKKVYEKGNKCVTQPFVLFVLPNKEAFKVGVVASKKLGKAVKRNRAKRRLREIVRLTQHSIPKNIWIVLIARYKILEIDFEQAKQVFLETLNRCLKQYQN